MVIKNLENKIKLVGIVCGLFLAGCIIISVASIVTARGMVSDAHKKIYVLDTNVLIQAPHALKCFDDNEVVLPLVVLEELDTHKRDEGERGANVREAIRILEQLRGQGDLVVGVELDNGGLLRVEKNFKDVELPKDMSEYKSDNRILKVCKGLKESSKEQVILVTKDILMRIKAQLLNIKSEESVQD